MTRRFLAPLSAMLVCALTVGPAVAAGGAIASAPMTLRAGPGDSFEELASISAGSRVDLHECDSKQWCRVDYLDLSGWVHVRSVERSNRAGSGGQGSVGVADGGSAGGGSAGGGSGGEGGKGGGVRSRGEASKSGDGSSGGGDSGISATDSASLPSDKAYGESYSTTAGDRLSHTVVNKP